MNAGQLKHRITLQRDDIVRADGAESKTPADYATVWASGGPLSGREFWQSQQVQSAIDYKWTIRWRGDVKAQHRVIYDGKTMEIRSVIPDIDSRAWVTLMCESRDR